MEIKEQDLLNYISCPIKYQVANNGYDICKKTYNGYMHDMFDYIITKYQYEGINNLDEKAKKKWDCICMKNQDIITPKNVIEGYGKLYKVYEYLKFNSPNFIDIKMPYEIKIGNHILTGQIDNLINKVNQIEMIIPSFSNKMIDSYVVDCDLKNTIDSYVIKHLFNKDVVFTHYNFSFNKYRYGLRTDRDYNRLNLIVDNVCKAIENNIIFPSSGYHCSSCIIKGLCNSWGINDSLAKRGDKLE